VSLPQCLAILTTYATNNDGKNSSNTLLSIFDYGVGRHICRRFELTAASRAGPEICDMLLVFIFRPFRNSQYIAAFRAGYPMVGTDGRYRCHGDPLGFIF
jgi:hypothetical protein